MPVTVGSKAPPFRLPSKPGHDVDVGAMLGRQKVVLLFFPLAFSGVCTAELCHIRDDWSKWSELGCTIVGISIDSPFVADKFRQELGLPFDILSDFNKDVCRAYDVLYDELMGLKGVSKRAAFVIDDSGEVRYAKVNASAKEQVDFDAIRQAVQSC